MEMTDELEMSAEIDMSDEFDMTDELHTGDVLAPLSAERAAGTFGGKERPKSSQGRRVGRNGPNVPRVDAWEEMAQIFPGWEEAVEMRLRCQGGQGGPIRDSKKGVRFFWLS